jgi:A/G-specific adenine glycosylase
VALSCKGDHSMTFTRILLEWYNGNARDLPWRKTRDPYRIWISEIILQQTRIGQGLGYYERFISRFQGIEDLANAGEEEVLKVWQGLGYYTRARNLHAAARQIMNIHGGKFPDRHEEVIRLKGIGEYTAAAVLSIAFGQPYPVVDGNVLRFISRHFGIHDRVDLSAGKKNVLEVMLQHIGKNEPGVFNQAVMEFGALLCVPGKPDCQHCPFRKSCHAFREGTVQTLPQKSGIKKQRKRYFHYFVIEWKNRKGQNHLFLRKRERNDVWKGLYDFPLIETDSEASLQELHASDDWRKILRNMTPADVILESGIYKRVLSHQVILARFYVIRPHAPQRPSCPYLLIPFDALKNYPVPRLIEDFLFKNPLVI